jgi:hypothetical protein
VPELDIIKSSMPPESSPAALPGGNDSLDSKKRKRIAEEHSSKQQTISDLITASHQTSAIYSHPNGKAITKPQTPTRKRSRIDPSSPRTSSPRRTFDTMYSFASSHTPKAPTVVDLTAASPSRKPFKASTSVGSQVGARRIVVKNLRQSRSDPRVYYDQVVAKLDAAVESILRKETQLPSSNEELYRGVENICKQGRDGDLYARLRSAMKRQAINVVKPKLEKQLAAHGDDPVPALTSTLTEWKAWKDAWVWIQS